MNPRYPFSTINPVNFTNFQRGKKELQQHYPNRTIEVYGCIPWEKSNQKVTKFGLFGDPDNFLSDLFAYLNDSHVSIYNKTCDKKLAWYYIILYRNLSKFNDYRVVQLLKNIVACSILSEGLRPTK